MADGWTSSGRRCKKPQWELTHARPRSLWLLARGSHSSFLWLPGVPCLRMWLPCGAEAGGQAELVLPAQGPLAGADSGSAKAPQFPEAPAAAWLSPQPPGYP